MVKEEIIKEIKEKIKKNPKYMHPCNKEFQEDMKIYGFENGNKFVNWMQNNGILKNPTNIDNKVRELTIKNAGFNSRPEYRKYIANRNGYKSESEQITERNWNRGISSPMSENECCSLYLGVDKAEKKIGRNIIPIIIGEIIEEMDHRNPGFDFIAGKNEKIDIKASTLKYWSNCQLKGWQFDIYNNRIADIFLLLGFDNVSSPFPRYIWKIGRNEMVKYGKGYIIKKFYKRESIAIFDNYYSLIHFQQYEQIDKLEKLKELRKELEEKL